MDVRQVARPFLRKLSVLDAGQIVKLEQFVPPARQVKDMGWVGRRMCPHCTAAAKVLLGSSLLR
ncbi:MAG: hypothetical protein ACETWR_23770 [Anaerolineae bacterium]